MMLVGNDAYWLILVSLMIVLTKGRSSHFRIDGKLPVWGDVIICVVAFVLCTAISFAAYFIYLRIRVNRLHRSDMKSTNHTETAVLLTNGDTLKKHNSFNESISINDVNIFHQNTEPLSAYISFGSYDIRKDSTSP